MSADSERKIEFIQAVLNGDAKTFHQVADLLDLLKPIPSKEMRGHDWNEWDHWLKFFFSRRKTATADQLITFCTAAMPNQRNRTREYLYQKIRQRCAKLGFEIAGTEKPGPKLGSKRSLH